MAIHFGKFFLSFVFLSICFQFAASVNWPEISPSPPPEIGADSPPSPLPVSQSPSANAPSPSDEPASSSPPAPPPETPAFSSSPSPSDKNSPVPSPSPNDASDINHSDINADGDQTKDSSGGMNGSKKAGIAVGVIAAACFVGLGALVFKKRQDNIRRSQYGYTARREIL